MVSTIYEITFPRSKRMNAIYFPTEKKASKYFDIHFADEILSRVEIEHEKELVFYMSLNEETSGVSWDVLTHANSVPQPRAEIVSREEIKTYAEPKLPMDFDE